MSDANPTQGEVNLESETESSMILTGLPFLFRPLPVGILLVIPFYELNEVLV